MQRVRTVTGVRPEGADFLRWFPDDRILPSGDVVCVLHEDGGLEIKDEKLAAQFPKLQNEVVQVFGSVRLMHDPQFGLR